jgi:hypothetical protein
VGPKKSNDKEQSPSWGPESETKFIDGLGSDPRGYTVERSYPDWLRLYIEVHQFSPHRHHQVGVEYAQKKLEQIYHG